MTQQPQTGEWNKTEWILCAAIHFNDGKEHVHQPINIESGFVVTGRRHHNCYGTLASIAKAIDLGERIKMMINKADRDHQGFITNLNRYVDRKEGWQIALKAGQIKIGWEASDNGEDSILISENLY